MSGRDRIRKKLERYGMDGRFTVEAASVYSPRVWNERIFAREAPLEIEIGFGKGEFLLEMAVMNPDVNFVGLEIDRVRVAWTEHKLIRAGVGNVRLIHGDAMKVVPLVFADSSLRAVYMNFPDPWPKKRHADRRMVNESFLSVLLDKLEPGGVMVVVSDVQAYVERTRSFFHSHSDVECLPLTEEGRLAGYPVTIHEEKFRRQGRSIGFAAVRKRSSSLLEGLM